MKEFILKELKQVLGQLLRENLLDEDIQAGSFLVYHRTNKENLKDFNKGYDVGTGAMYGAGLYTTYTLEAQMRPQMLSYGKFVIEFKIPNTGKFIILDSSEAKKVFGPKYGLMTQLKRVLGGYFNSFYSANKEALLKCESHLERVNYTSEVAVELSRIPGFIGHVDGMVFTGQNDGKVLVLYETNLANPIQYYDDNENEWHNIKDLDSFGIGKDMRKPGKILNQIAIGTSLAPEDIIKLLKKEENLESIGLDYLHKLLLLARPKSSEVVDLLLNNPKFLKRMINDESGEIFDLMISYSNGKDSMIDKLMSIPEFVNNLNNNIICLMLKYTDNLNSLTKKYPKFNEVFNIIGRGKDADDSYKLLDALFKGDSDNSVYFLERLLKNDNFIHFLNDDYFKNFTEFTVLKKIRSHNPRGYDYFVTELLKNKTFMSELQSYNILDLLGSNVGQNFGERLEILVNTNKIDFVTLPFNNFNIILNYLNSKSGNEKTINLAKKILNTKGFMAKADMFKIIDLIRLIPEYYTLDYIESNSELKQNPKLIELVLDFKYSFTTPEDRLKFCDYIMRNVKPESLVGDDIDEVIDGDSDLKNAQILKIVNNTEWVSRLNGISLLRLMSPWKSENPKLIMSKLLSNLKVLKSIGLHMDGNDVSYRRVMDFLQDDVAQYLGNDQYELIRDRIYKIRKLYNDNLV